MALHHQRVHGGTAALLLVAACQGSATTTSVASTSASASASAARDTAIEDAQTMKDALLAAHFKDTTDTIDRDTAAFAVWAARKMKFTDVKAEETTIGEAMKDSDAERGKRLCDVGLIAQIEARELSGVKVHEGILLVGSEPIHFLAAGPTSGLVARTPAGFCGVFTGRFRYKDSSGGTTTAITVVGMFAPEK